MESLKLEAAEIEQPTTPAINFDKRVAGPDQTFGVTIFFLNIGSRPIFLNLNDRDNYQSC